MKWHYSVMTGKMDFISEFAVEVIRIIRTSHRNLPDLLCIF